MAAKKKRMTQKEKDFNRKYKKELQEKGLIPPDKKRLNRKKFIEEAVSEWNDRDSDCYIWDFYLMRAVGYMTAQVGRNLNPTPEAVGVAKLLKAAMTDPTTMKLRPYWKYTTAGDGQVRETHAMMEGRIYRADDPIWDIWYPPNGFRCRCSVVSMTKAQVERSGVEVSKRAPYDIDFSTGEIKYRFPDKGFSNNPAKSAWKPDLSGFDPSLKKEFKKRENKDIEK